MKMRGGILTAAVTIGYRQNSRYHRQEVSSGGQTATVRDLRSVSGGMSQHAILLDRHLTTQTRQVL